MVGVPQGLEPCPTIDVKRALRREVEAIEVWRFDPRKAFIQALCCEAGFFEKTAPASITKLEAEDKALGPKIDALLAEWEALEAELAEATAKA